jgi:F-type H+-transporting ATPase subunit delta
MTGIVGRNYARALFELAAETSSLEAVETDVNAARDALYADRPARDFLGNRLIGKTTKRNLVTRAFEGVLDPRVLVLLFILVDRGRTTLLGEIAEEFERLSRQARGARKVRLVSAFPLGETERARITGSLEARFASRVELETEIRPSLIGGVVAESEGQEIEYSIEGELKDLATQLQAQEQTAADAEGIEGRQDHAH